MFTLKLTLLISLMLFYSPDKGFVLTAPDGTQNAYDVIFERAQVVWFDPAVYDNFEIVTYKYNRTVASYNLTMALHVDVPAFKLAFHSYKLYVTEYKLTAIQFDINGCALVKLGRFGFKTYRTNSNFTDCPMKKGIYTLYNAYVDSSTFPPHFPEGKWKFQASTVINKETVLKLDFYVSVIYPVKYGRK